MHVSLRKNTYRWFTVQCSITDDLRFRVKGTYLSQWLSTSRSHPQLFVEFFQVKKFRFYPHETDRVMPVPVALWSFASANCKASLELVVVDAYAAVIVD